MNSRDDIRAFYDAKYNKKSDTVSGMRRIRQNLHGMALKPGDRVLDVGCGIGTTCAYLKQMGISPVGIDISFRAVQATLQLKHCAHALQSDAEALPFSDCIFDGAVFMGTLEHFPNPASALYEVRRVLKKHALICFVVPNSRFFLFWFLQGTGQPHEEPRTYEGWRALFEATGFEVETVYRDVGPGLFKGGVVRGVLRKLILMISSLLPLHQTYQFVFICHNG